VRYIPEDRHQDGDRINNQNSVCLYRVVMITPSQRSSTKFFSASDNCRLLEFVTFICRPTAALTVFFHTSMPIFLTTNILF